MNSDSDEDMGNIVRSRNVVLLVEDEVFIRIASADWLREAGFDVIEAADAGEALDIVDSGQRFDILATDITMPGALDGLGLALTVRARAIHTPILLLSARLPDDISAYADRALAKPYEGSLLVATIKEMVAPLCLNRIGSRKAC